MNIIYFFHIFILLYEVRRIYFDIFKHSIIEEMLKYGIFMATLV